MLGPGIGKSVLATILLLAAAPAAAGQTPVPCPAAEAAVAGATETERDLICAGIADAAGFLADCGIARTSPLVVTVHADMREVCATPAHALYDASRDAIEIARLDTCRSASIPGDLFDWLEAESAYRSLAAPETAHAIVTTRGVALDRIAAQEYIAAVVQFASLTPDERAILTESVAARPIELQELNVTIYALKPLRFAAKSAIHFVQLPDGCAFITDLVDGTVRLAIPR